MILPKNIMIVEDEVTTQHYLKDILITKDIAVVACLSNAKETLKIFQDIQYDMILMDLDLNGSIDGLSLTREILSKINTPVIFITAYGDEETKEEARDLSPYGFLSKPFSSQDILLAIELGYNKFIVNNKKISLFDDIILENDYKFSIKKSTLYHKDTPVLLSPRQEKLIYLLAKNYQTVVSSQRITKEIWGDKETSNSNLRNFIYTIRKVAPKLSITSNYNSGYTLS